MKTLKFAVWILTILIISSCGKDEAESEKPIEKPQEEPQPRVYLEPGFINLPFEMHPMVSSGTDFAFTFFKQVADEFSGNLFVSPYSLGMALGMLYNGAENETKKEIAAVMGMSGYTPEQVNNYYQTLTKGLLAVDTKTNLSVANAIWTDKGFPLKKNFSDLNKLYYDAEIRTMDFSQPSALQAINDWSNEKTKGTIPRILEELEPPTVLANATYFKSAWTVPFEKSGTTKKPFYNHDGTTSTVEMMHQKEMPLHYTHTADYELVRLPYSNGSFSMNILLPKEGVDIDEVLESLDGKTWETLTSALYGNTVHVTLSMPRFTIENELELNDVLKAMGMPRAFSDKYAQFLAMLDTHSWVGRVLQKSYIDVSEEGTEASAVTVIVMCMSDGGPLPPPQYATVVVNRPFIFAITEQSTGAILFMGKVNKL